MTDKELTELAAKASCNAQDGFSPLDDDGDALRLAVKLGMEMYHGYNDGPAVFAAVPKRNSMPAFVVEMHDCDPHAATRRAITRAAAEIGKAMS